MVQLLGGLLLRQACVKHELLLMDTTQHSLSSLSDALLMLCMDHFDSLLGRYSGEQCSAASLAELLCSAAITSPFFVSTGHHAQQFEPSEGSLNSAEAEQVCTHRSQCSQKTLSPIRLNRLS